MRAFLHQLAGELGAAAVADGDLYARGRGEGGDQRLDGRAVLAVIERQRTVGGPGRPRRGGEDRGGGCERGATKSSALEKRTARERIH